MTRTPPENLQAEQAVLGSMLLDPDSLIDALTQLAPSDFGRTQHSTLFAAIEQMHLDSIPVDTLTVADYLETRSQLAAAGSKPYLLELMDAAPVTRNIGRYAKIVKRNALLRALIVTGTELVTLGYEAPEDPEILLAEASTKLHDALTGTAAEAPTLQTLAVDAARFVQYRATHPGLLGLPTGIPTLDELLNGLQPSSLYVVAARPSVGKSALTENFCSFAAEQGNTVLLHSLEQNDVDSTLRIACSVARVDSHAAKSGSLDPASFKRLMETFNTIKTWPLTIDEEPGIHYATIVARATKMHASRLDLLAVDYLGLVGYGDNDSHVRGLGEICKAFKNLAKRLKIPVILDCQMSRASGKENRRPVLTDLRDSGEIEQHADAVIFIHREEAPPNPGGVADPPNYELIVAKHRHGPIGTIPVAYIAPWTRFWSIAKN